jgi:hypothetical protein
MNIIKAIAITTVLFSSAASAELDQAKKFELCDITSEVATVVMRNRQEGIPMATMMKITNEQGSSEATKKLNIEIIVDAYKAARFDSAEYKEKAITEFANKYYSACLVATN